MDEFFRRSEVARRIVACVTATPLVARPLQLADGPAMELGLPDPGRLRADGLLRQAAIRTELRLRPGGASGEPQIDRYGYALLDRNGTELLVWHFHPATAMSSAAFPHLHVSASLRPAAPHGERGMLPLDKLHLPSGMVPLAMFVRMLIEEFGVEPLARDWEARLLDA